jgi:hypothetical protein
VRTQVPEAVHANAGRLLPFTITADEDIGAIGSINIITVPREQYLSPERIRELTAQEPQVIEPEPEPTNVTRIK